MNFACELYICLRQYILRFDFNYGQPARLENKTAWVGLIAKMEGKGCMGSLIIFVSTRDNIIINKKAIRVMAKPK